MRNDKMTIKKYLGIILCLLSFWAMADDYEIELVPFDSPHKKLQPRLVQHAMPSIMYWYTLTEGQQSSYAAPYFDWARNIKLDGKPGFEIYQRGKYIDRRPFTRLKLKVGDHTLDPGKHVFTVAKDGTVSTKDEDIVLSTIKGRIAYIPENLKKGINDKGVVTVKRIQSLEEADEESNLIWELTNGDKVKVLGTENGWVKLELAPLHLIKLKLYPISIHATNADLKAPPPKELFYAISLPNVVLRLADDKRLKPEELIFRIRAATKERKNLYKYFEIWLPSNKVGKGYLAFPLKHTFHIDKNGITNGAGGGYDAKWLTNPKAKGIKKYRIDIPVNRVPVYGDALNTCLIANMQFIKIPQFASGDLEYANLYVRNEPYEIRVTEKGPSLSISGNLSDLPNKAIRLGWTDAYKINQKLLLVEAESTHLTAGQKMRVRVRALDPSKSSEAEAEAINTENFIKAMETAYKGIERGINTNLNNIGRASKDLIQLSQVRQKAQKKWSIAAGNLKRALGQEKAILGRVATYTKQVNQFKKQIADAQKKAAAEKDANKKKPLLARVKPIQTRLKAATTNLTKQQAALKKTQVIVAKDKKTEAITKVQHTNEADAHNKLIKQSAKHPKIEVLRKVNEQAKKKLVESQAKIDRYKKILVTQRATRLKRTNYNPLANAPAFAQIRDFNDSNWQPVKVEAASPNAKAGSKEANEWFLTLPSKMRDGIYKLRIGVKPVQKDEQIFHVEQWVTISAGTGLGIGVFTQRSRTAFYRGETFWLALGVLGGTRSIPAGTKIEADLVDENGIRVPIVRETVKSEIKDRKTYVVTLSGEQTLNLAPGTYRVEPKLGTQDGPVFKLYIVDPQPKTNFINMLLGKYNQVGFDYSSLLSGGNAISQRSVQLGGQHADSRLSADMVVKDLAESGYNSFKGMSYGMNRVFFPSSRTIRMLVEERPELGPWEAFAPPSGRDLFLDACVKNNIAFYENLFTQHDSIMPRGEKFLAACDRYSTLEAASMRHSPAFRGLCMYDEFSHSLDHDTAQVVMTHFHKMDEKGFRKKYGYSSSDAQIAMDRFTGRPEGQRDYKDLVKYKAYPKYIDWTWEEFSRRMTNSIHDMMPGSVNFTLARVAAHPGDNLGIGNGNIATVFAPLELATAVGYKDMGGWGAFPLSGPLMADAFRINDTLKSVPMLAGQRTGSYGDSNLRDAFMTLSQKPDGLSFMQYDTSIQTSVGTDHYSTVRDIARNLTTRYGDFILYSKKGYKKVAIYDSREAKFLSIRKSVNVSLANEALWASCLRAGYPADFLTDQQILKDKGMDYDVIIAPGWIFKEEVPPKTLEALKRLKQAGKIIIVEKSSNLPIPGIVRLRLPSVKGAEKEAIDLDEIEDRLGGMFPKYLDVDNERWWKHTIKITAALKETLSKYIPPAAEGHDMLLSPDWLQSQEGSYMIMSNHAYTGFKGNHKTLFQAPQVFDITVIDKPPVCYDMLEMKQVPVKKLANKRSSIKVDMRTYPGKFYAFLPTAIDHLTIKTSPAVAGQNMSFEISITDKSGKMIPAGFPVEIKLTNEKGQILRHVFRSGTPVYKGIYRVPVNCPGNKIKLWARELISGSSCEATAAYIAKPFVPKKSANADVRISEIDKIKRFINEECKVATPLFTAKDIRKPGRLAIRIRKPRNIQQPGRSNWYKDKMSAYIKSKCTEAELKVMHAYDPKKGQSKELYATIVTVLNRIIQDGRLFSKKRFPPGFLTASDNDVGEDVTNPKSFLDINRYLLTKFYSEELIAGEVIYVTTDEKWLVEDAWRLGDMLMAKGYRVRVLPSQAFVRGPARGWNHTDKELPFLDGSRMWRGSVVKPGVFLDGPVIVLGRRWTLANHLIKRDALPEPITENFPGAGRCLVGWVPKAFSNYHNTLYVLTNDKDGLKKGIDALINIDKQKANVFIHRPLVKEKATKAAVQMKTFEGNSKDLKSYREMHSDEDRVTAIDTDTATGRSVFGTFGYGKNLFCFDKAGKLLWKTFLPEHNVYYAKWIDGGKKIVASTGHGFFIFILDATNGKVIKKFASTEWPDLHVGEREHNTEVRIILNPPLRQIFVFGATGLLAVDYDGKKMWFKDRVKEIVEYPAEAVQTSFATFGKYLLMEGFEISPDGSKVIYNERLVIGSTYGFAGSIINLWGNQPQIFDAKTGRLLLKSTTADPGTNIKWEVTWGKEGPYIHANSLAAPLLFVNPNRKSGVDPGKLGAFRPPFVDWLKTGNRIETDFHFVKVFNSKGQTIVSYLDRSDVWMKKRDLFSADDKLYYRTGRKGGIFCLDLATGKKVWSQQIDGIALLSLAGKDLMVGSRNGRILRIAPDGKIVWQTQLRKHHEMPGGDYSEFLQKISRREVDSTPEFYPIRTAQADDFSKEFDFGATGGKKDAILKMGINQLANGDFTKGSENWKIEGDDKLKKDKGGKALRVSITPKVAAKGFKGKQAALTLLNKQQMLQTVDRKVVKRVTYLLEFYYKVESYDTVLAAAALLDSVNEKNYFNGSNYTAKPGEWTFGRLAIKSLHDTDTLRIGFEAGKGKVEIANVKLRIVRFPSANILGNLALHKIKPTHAKDVRNLYNKIPQQLREFLMTDNGVTVMMQSTPLGALVITQEPAFLHNGRLDDLDTMWCYKPNPMGFAVSLKEPTYVSHIVLYMNNVKPNIHYKAMSILANDFERKVPVTVGVVRGDHRRFIVIPIKLILTDNIKILPGHSRTQLDTITEIEVYGPVGGIEQMGKKSFVADAKATHMFMGNAKHVPTNLPGDLTGPLKKVNLPSMPTIPGASALHSGMTIVKGIATFPQADGLLHYRPVTVKANLLKKQRENAAIVKARLNKTKAPVAFKGWKGSTVTPITTPTRYANRLLVGSADYKMHAIGDNGAHLWGFKTDGRVYSAPTPHEAEVYFGSDDGYLYKVDIDSGILIWQFKTNGRIRSAPVVADKKVYVASWDGNVYAVDLTMGDLRWKAPIASTTSTSLAYSKGKLYIGDEDGNLHCLNAANGKPAWKPVNIKGERFSQCAVVCPDGVYFQGDYGTGVFLNLNTGAEKWPKKDVLKPLSKPLETPARVTGQVFATKTQLIIPHTRGLLVLKRATGIPDAAYKAPAVFKHVLSAAIYDNHLCVTESITHAQVNPEKRFVISHGTKMTVWQK